VALDLLGRVLSTPYGTIHDCDEWDGLMWEIDGFLTAVEWSRLRRIPKREDRDG
jgi:hypothetical protein